MKRTFFLLIFLTVVMLFGCSSFGGGYAEAGSSEQYRDTPAFSAPAPSAKMAAPRSEAMAEPMAMDMPAEELSDLAAGPAAEPAATPEKPDEPEERLRVYSGLGRLIVEDVDDTKEEISRLAEDNGGYVEGVWGNVVVIRVPAGQFHALFDRVLTFGEVDFKRVETVDVTEYFTDMTARLEIAKATRARLYVLLEKTEDVEERLRILREIRRLTEDIEGIQNTLRSLEKQIAFSRIQVELQPRLSEEALLRNEIPFPWISNLDPLYPALGGLKGDIQVPIDDSFAVFSGDDIYRAEDTRGVRVRISRTDNTPRGDTVFWQEALVFHLSPFYAAAERLDFQEGEVRGVLFTSKDTKPFLFLVAQRTRGDEVIVCEAFFPNSEEFKRAGDMVYKTFDGMVLP